MNNIAVNLLKAEILLDAERWDYVAPENCKNLQDRWDAFMADDIHWEVISEFRRSGEPTGLNPDWSRHYESTAVARKCGDTWVGWTYWYGGGKFGEPDAVPWIEDTYLLDCVEHEELVTVRTFSLIKSPE